MIRSVRAVALLATFAASAVLVAGCGDTAAKNDYVEANNAIQTELQTAMSKIDPSGDEASLTAAQESFQKAADDLEALDPPEDWKDEHADLVAAVDEMEGTIDALLTAADEKDTKAMTDSITKMSELEQRASAAIDAMNADR